MGDILGQADGVRVQSNDEDLAKTLANPVANLFSVPFQINDDFRVGPNPDGVRDTVNFHPVIPLRVGNEWLLVSRTILPIVNQSDTSSGSGTSLV